MRNIFAIAIALTMAFSVSGIEGAGAFDTWIQCGAFGETGATIVLGTPGFSIEPDMCFDTDGNPHLVWSDSLSLGDLQVFKPVHMWFNGYSFRGDGKGSRTLDYIDDSYHIGASPAITRLASGNLLAVWATNVSSNSYLYWSVRDALGNWSYPKTVTTYIAVAFVIESSPSLITGPGGTWLAFIKETQDREKYLAVSMFDEASAEFKPLPGDLEPMPWGTVIDLDFDLLSPKVVEYQNIPVVFVEGVVSQSNSEIFCGRWNPGSGKWTYFFGTPDGLQNISNSPRPSHTPDACQNSLGYPMVVWSESYQGSQDSGVAYTRWNGNWVDLGNQPGFSMITPNDGSGSATNPSITVDSTERGMVAFDFFDRASYRDSIGYMFHTSGTFVNPQTGQTGFAKIKHESYAEFTDSRIVANPSDPDSPIIIGVAKTPTAQLLRLRNNQDTNIFYSVIRKNPANPLGNPISVTARPTVFPDFEPSSSFSITPSEKAMDFFISVNQGLPTYEKVYLLFNSYYSLIANPWPGSIQPNLLDLTKWQQLSGEFFNPVTGLWDSTFPPTEITRAFRFNAMPNPVKIKMTLYRVTVPQVKPNHPKFFYGEMFTSDLDYIPAVNLPPLQDAVFDPPFASPLPNQNRFCGKVEFTDIESKQYILLEPQYYEVDQGSTVFGSYLVTNPQSPANNLYPTYSFKLTEISGVNGLGLFIGFNPNNFEVQNKPWHMGTIVIHATPEAKPVMYSCKVLCEIKIPGQTGSLYFMADLRVRVKAYDLTVRKIANKSRADIGEVVEYSITVHNIGDGTAYYVEVFDNLPRELQFVSASHKGYQDGAKVVWMVERIFGGETVNLKLRVRIRDDVGLRNGDLIINSARLKSGKGSKETSIGILIQTYLPGCPRPQVEFRLSVASRETVNAGDEITGKLTVIEGCGPFDSFVNWGDGGRSQKVVIGESNTASIKFTYQAPGDYTISITVNDIYGKATNIYRHIRVN